MFGNYEMAATIYETMDYSSYSSTYPVYFCCGASVAFMAR
jgi:hypothetical protein